MHAVIMAGGAGTRFWPRSRARRPKQLLPVFGARSLIRCTFERLLPLVPPERLLVVKGGAREPCGDVRGARMLVRVEDVALVAELRRGDAQHPPELASADNPNGRARRDGHSGVSATDPVWVSRQDSRRLASWASPVARIAAASTAVHGPANIRAMR